MKSINNSISFGSEIKRWRMEVKNVIIDKERYVIRKSDRVERKWVICKYKEIVSVVRCNELKEERVDEELGLKPTL